MLINIFEGILIPFVGTTLGAACVFFMRKTLSKSVQRALAGVAAGIMVAASIWSLLIPAIKQSENMEMCIRDSVYPMDIRAIGAVHIG